MSNEPIPKPVFITHTWVAATHWGSLPDEVGLPHEGRRGAVPIAHLKGKGTAENIW
jgi:hypothetical protein